MGKAETVTRKFVHGAADDVTRPKDLGQFRMLLAIILIFGGLTVAGVFAETKYNTNIAHFRKHGPALLNDLALTPGFVRSTSKTSVCSGGSTKQYRKTTEAMKNQAYAEYGVEKKVLLAGTRASVEDGKRPLYEIDHLISLELGGADDVRNLWPQPYYQHPGAHEKDTVENWLHKEVCSGGIELEEAQKEIATDWYVIYLRMHQATADNSEERASTR
jgi:hypothetical protein